MSLHNLPKSAWLAALQHTELTQMLTSELFIAYRYRTIQKAFVP